MEIVPATLLSSVPRGRKRKNLEHATSAFISKAATVLQRKPDDGDGF